MVFEAPALTWMPSPRRRPVVTLISRIYFRSTVADGKYSLSVLSKLLKAFMMDEQQNERGGRTDRKVKNRMPSPTVSGGKHQRFNVSERDAYVQ